MEKIQKGAESFTISKWLIRQFCLVFFFFMRSYADHFKHFFLSGVIEKNSNGKGQQK